MILNKTTIKFSAFEHIKFSFVLFFAFVVIRLSEWFFCNQNHILPTSIFTLELKGILSEFFYASFIAMLLYLPYLFLFLWKRKLATWFHVFCLFIFSIAYWSVSQYFIKVLTPLSSDFWGYSLNEIKTTIAASGGVNYLTYISILLIAILVVLSYILLRKLEFKPLLFSISLFILLSGIVGQLFFKPKMTDYTSSAEYYMAENKLHYFIVKSLESNENQIVENSKFDESYFKSHPFPLMHSVKPNDVIGDFFNTTNELPNLVFIQVEGLGKSFVGDNAQYAGFTPFLDSLLKKSLFWENCLSTAGRTFGILPSMYGSLPFSNDGFMEMGTKMPKHITLISLLKQQGYACNYYYGGNANFDKQDIFMERQGIDFVLNDDKFSKNFVKMKPSEGGESWGYPDRALFLQSLTDIKNQNKVPRLDIYMTLTTHEPFIVPEEKFKSIFDQVYVKSKSQNKEVFSKYRNIFECLLYTDDAIRNFINEYKKRSDFNNTIFIITGDHRMIPVPHSSEIDRFHVPLFIWSPMIKNAQTFSSVVSHSNIPATMLYFLKNKYNISIPDSLPFIANEMLVKKEFSSNLDLPIMRNKGDLSIYLYNNFYLCDNVLYEMSNHLELKPSNNEKMRKVLVDKLNTFKIINKYVCENDKIYDGKLALIESASYQFSVEEQKYIKDNSIEKLMPDDKFFKARDLSRTGDYKNAKIILKLVLNDSPNYADARILFGRIDAWSKNYTIALVELKEAVKRAPTYNDAYYALIDCLFWADMNIEALKTLEKALEIFKNDPELISRKQKIMAKK
ncbi:MAG: sulfatase-like hydrolase/transferase [Bacteroidota bacterium]